MNWRSCGWGRRCRQTHPYANVRSKERQARFNAFDGFCHWRRSGRDGEGVRDHAVWARIAEPLVVVSGMLTGTTHCTVDPSLSELIEPCSLWFGQSLRTNADDKFAIAGLRWHPACRDDVRHYQRNR